MDDVRFEAASVLASLYEKEVESKIFKVLSHDVVRLFFFWYKKYKTM